MTTIDDAWFARIPRNDQETLLARRNDGSPNGTVMAILTRSSVGVSSTGFTANPHTTMYWPDGVQAFLEREYLKQNPTSSGVAGDLPGDR